VAEVKWIKITKNIFDDEKIKLIDTMPDRDALLVIWFKLLTLAGKTNDNGFVYIIKEMPTTDEMLATIFNRSLNTVRLALKTFAQFNMIEIDSHVNVVNWEKHQNIDGLDKIKEQSRLRQQKFKEKKKSLMLEDSKSNVMVTFGNATDIELDIDKEIEKERDKDTDIEITTLVNRKRIDPTDYLKIVDLYHSICKSLPSISKLTESRKKAIKNRLKDYTEDDIIQAFSMAQQSKFLTGDNDRNWTATFDFILKPEKFVGILEGKYSNKEKTQTDIVADKYNSDVVQNFLNGGKVF